MQRAIAWLLVASVVTVSLVSMNQCPASDAMVTVGKVLAAGGHANLLTGSTSDTMPIAFSAWPSGDDLCAAPGMRQVAHMFSDGVLTRTSATIAPATPPPRQAI